MTFVGFVSASNTAERFCGLGHECFDFLPGGVRVDGEGHLDVVETVADIRVGAEDPADVVVTLDCCLDRAQLDATVLRDRRHARGEAARQADEEVFDRRDGAVVGGEDLGVVGVEDRFGLVLLLLAETEEVLNLRRAVDAVLPLRGCSPGELRSLRRAFNTSRASSNA